MKRSWMTFLLFASAVAGCESRSREEPVQHGDLSLSGGSPTIRRPVKRPEDVPWTTNNESNDQSLGYFGSETMSVSSFESGNNYTLDVDRDGDTVNRVYFPKGGWVDFPACELDADGTGDCEDEQGRTWSFEGEVYGTADSYVGDEENGEADEELTMSEWDDRDEDFEDDE